VGDGRKPLGEGGEGGVVRGGRNPGRGLGGRGRLPQPGVGGDRERGGGGGGGVSGLRASKKKSGEEGLKTRGFVPAELKKKRGETREVFWVPERGNRG